MTKQIQLKRLWTIDGAPIGSGGFGRVYPAVGDDGDRVALKLIPKAPGSDREMLFVSLKQIRNIIPVIDSGEFETNWAIVMPRAKMSLRDHLRATGPLNATEATKILCDIATALVDLVGRKIVHRDLKPENVLLLNGNWCLSDFGISRYAESATAPDTQKYAMSPPYAAPERWKAERATIAADVYALGTIAFEMLSGGPPYSGPTWEDYRDQHLHSPEPALASGSSALRAIVSECLFKAPGSRPGPANLLARLEKSGVSRSSGLARLNEANLKEVERQSEETRKQEVAQSVAVRRQNLFVAGMKLLDNLFNEMSAAILESAPTAKLEKRRADGSIRIRLGEAELELASVSRTSQNPWEWQGPSFDVIATTGIAVHIPQDRYGFMGRSHSLWYCDAFEAGHYQWIELAFMISPMVAHSFRYKPTMLHTGPEAAKALWNGMSEFQLAWPLEAVEAEDFIDRWASWFADAAQGQLRSPSTMPERPTPRNWRER